MIYALDRVKQKFPAKKRYQEYKPDHFYIFLAYGKELALRLDMPPSLTKAAQRLAKPFVGKDIVDPAIILKLLAAAQKLEASGEEVTIYPDAEEFISKKLHQHRIATRMESMRKERVSHPIRTELLKTELLPYQVDGIAFATGAGRAILADDMGLGRHHACAGRLPGLAQVAVVCRDW